MSRYRLTFGFVQYTAGPTETYISPDLSDGQATAKLQKLINLRNELLNTRTQWAGVRIAKEGEVGVLNVNKRRSVFYNPGTYQPFVINANLVVPANGTFPGNTETSSLDQFRACLQIRLKYDTDRRAIRYLGLVPDGILQGEPASARPDLLPFWHTALNNFTNELVEGGWSVKARDRGAGFTELAIIGWTSAAAAPTNLGIVLPSLPAPNIAVGDRVSVKGVRRKGTDRTSYNGHYIVDAVNTTLLPDRVIIYLRGTETGDPASVKLLGTVQKVGKNYFAIQGVEIVRAGTHKRGKPLGAPVGRRKTRLSLDP